MSIFSSKNTGPSSSPSFSSINLFGCTSGIQQTSNSSGNPSVPQVFGTTTSSASPLAPPFGSSTPFGGTFGFNAAKNSTSGQTQNISPGLSTLPTFGKKYEGNNVGNESLLWSRDANVSNSSTFESPKAPAFGVASNSHFGTPRFDSYSFGQPAVSTSGSKGKESTTPLFKSSGFGKSAFGINQKGSRIASYIATPETDSINFGGAKIQSICGMHTFKDKSQEELRFEDYQLGDKGQNCGSSFGVPGTQGFGVLNNTRPFKSPVFNQSPVDQPFYSIRKESTTPLFKSSGFGKSAFGINQKGSRIASYIATPEKDSINFGGANIQSICGMHTYKDKSQEEMRFEDYQLGDKGQNCGSSFGVPGTQGFGVIDNTSPFKSPVFNQSTVDQPFYSHFPSTFAVQRAGVDSLSNENSTTTASSPFPKPQQSIPHIFSPKTSFFNSSDTGSRVESTASDVPFPPWNHSNAFAPLKPASSSSTFPQLRNPWAISTSSTPSLTQSLLFPCSVSPSIYPSLAKPSGHDSDQKNYCFPTPALTTGAAPQSTLCLNCLKQSQPTPPSFCNVSSTQSVGLENLSTSSQLSTCYPLTSSQNNPEMTPSIGATLPTTIASHPSTEVASCSEIGKGVGQPSINGQQSYFPRIMEVKPSPIMLPAEIQPSVQISVKHPNLATSIQYGISSLPVSNNPAPVRRKSSLIIRHSSLSQRRLPPQKYKPTSDKPKVPFFMDKDNASGLPTTEVIIIPRENPRAWVRPTDKEFSLGADSCRLSQLKHTSMDSMHDGDKVRDKPNLAPEEMHYDNCGQLKHCFQLSLGSADEAGTDDRDVDATMPKLQRADYYTVPPIKELISKEKEEAGFCCRVKEFVVGRHGCGSIKFLGETDVRKLDLDSAVHFNCREVIIYMDESKKPPVGQGLNKPAEITLLNVRCINKSTGKEYKDGPAVNKYRDMLIKKAVEQGAEFVSYDPMEGQWKFRVSHF